ncbi:unnamed protein product [Mytilus coruscus]|uniref:Reverse transcriptase domain-containing protein n=1 Tax=Mytilus coruscus TaxID=42192 RepID=A0A6J8CJN3_MYTCO|nr:unnamed protein product [Mytilus coruscus]
MDLKFICKLFVIDVTIAWTLCFTFGDVCHPEYKGCLRPSIRDLGNLVWGRCCSLGVLRRIGSISLLECAKECFLTTGCFSLNYRHNWHVCELLERHKNMKNGESNYNAFFRDEGCVHSNISTWTKVKIIKCFNGLIPCREIYNTFNFGENEADKLEVLLKKFEDYCIPKKNVTVIRNRFNTRVQNSSESIDQYLTDMKLIAKNCEFEHLKDGLIRDRIVCGTNSSRVKERLLREDGLTLDKAVGICRADEESRKQMKTLNEEEQVHALRRKTQNQRTNRNEGYAKKGPSRRDHEARVEFEFHYSGDKLKVVGKCSLHLKDKNCKFFVTDTNQSPLLGFKASNELGLIHVIMTVQTDVDDPVKSFPKVFTGLGCLEKPYHIKIDSSVNPVINPPRKIPAALQERLKGTLKEMEDKEVIRKVDEPTDWVNSLVVVEKPKTGKLRICLDPRNLNKAIKREHFALPTIEDITTRLTGAKYLSKLDCNNGYWQLRMDKESQLLTTFNSPFGRYCFLRMPFGIKSAQEVFQKRVSQLFENLKGVETDIDDILVWGTTRNEHDDRLRSVLNRCQEVGR